MRLTRRRLAVLAAVVLLAAAGYVWLALWANERSQRFFHEQRPDWAR